MGCDLRIAEASKGNCRMNRFALGTAQFGCPYGIANQEGQVSRMTAKAMLQLATENGIDTLDTAIGYNESENCLGEAGTQKFKLVTKLPAVPNSCADVTEWVKKETSDSLIRLDVSAVYGLLLHRPDQLLGINGKTLYKALQGLKEKGQVQKIGVSIYAPSELEALTPQYRFDLVQAPCNLIDRRLHNTGWLQRLKQDGIEIHARSIFLQGLLLMPRSAIPAKFAPWTELWDKWHNWLGCHTVSAVQACLAYPLSFPEIDRVVVGADSVRQLEQIINSVLSVVPVDLPDLRCDDESLINPARWNQL